jgi:L-lactate dehydrogenase
MKVGIWGAGNLGCGLAYRLATTTFVSEIFWANRTYENIERKIIDIQHGLAFAPTCRAIHGYRQERIAEMLLSVDVLILTLGELVLKDKTRNDVFEANAKIYRNSVIPALHGKFNSIVVVISNPVDLMARLVFKEAGIDSKKVIGLGTVVETARLKASLSSYLSPQRAARDIWASAIGTHDENFVPIVKTGLAVGDTTKGASLDDIIELAKKEVVKAANRVKTEDGSSLHPIVEGTVSVLETIALDQRKTLTVSVLDPETPDNLFYSVPCCIGAAGLVWRFSDFSDEEKKQVAVCCENLRKTLKGRFRPSPPI